MDGPPFVLEKYEIRLGGRIFDLLTVPLGILPSSVQEKKTYVSTWNTGRRFTNHHLLLLLPSSITSTTQAQEVKAEKFSQKDAKCDTFPEFRSKMLMILRPLLTPLKSLSIRASQLNHEQDPNFPT